MKRIILFLVVAIFVFSASAQVTKKEKYHPRFKHKLGAMAGWATGSGIAYRYMPKDFGINLIYGIADNGERTYMDAGIMFLYSIYQNKFIGVNIYQSNNIRDKWNIKEEYYYDVSLGAVFELFIMERIAWNFMFGYSAMLNFELILPTPSVGLYYRF